MANVKTLNVAVRADGAVFAEIDKYVLTNARERWYNVGKRGEI